MEVLYLIINQIGPIIVLKAVVAIFLLLVVL